MRAISRRDLFKQLVDSVSDQFVSGKETNAPRESGESTWVPLTRLSEMAPGQIFLFEKKEGRGVLHSDGSGLFALLEDGRSVALRTTPHGLIEMNIKEEWPQGQVLSHLTGLAVFSE